MIFREGDEVLYRENPADPPKLGYIIGTGHVIDDVYFVALQTVDGTQHVVTAKDRELTTPKKNYKVANANQLARKDKT